LMQHAVSLSEAATFAGFLHAPSTSVTWEGDVLVPQARERRDRVLKLMQDQGMISAEEREKAEAAPLNFAPDPPPGPRVHALPRKGQAQRGGTREPQALQRGGLRIHTTLDPDLQHAAVETSQDVLPYPNDPSAASGHRGAPDRGHKGPGGPAGRVQFGPRRPSPPGTSPEAPSSPSCSPRL
jgi:membrane peptidoglycan carboxypeptidase